MSTRTTELNKEMNDLLRWKKQATKEQWDRLAQLAETTVGHLNQLAYGFRRASAEKAIDISSATMKFRDPNPVTKEAIVFAPVFKSQKQKDEAA